jgi:hypothetical protein
MRFTLKWILNHSQALGLLLFLFLCYFGVWCIIVNLRVNLFFHSTSLVHLMHNIVVTHLCFIAHNIHLTKNKKNINRGITSNGHNNYGNLGLG